jgi:hypothetical protein
VAEETTKASANSSAHISEVLALTPCQIDIAAGHPADAELEMFFAARRTSPA